MIFAQQRGGQRGGDQHNPPPIPNNNQIEKMVSKLADEISLTGEQENNILDLYKEHFRIVKEKTSGNNRPRREEMELLKNDLEKKVKKDFTDQQQIKYKAFLKKQKSQRHR